MKQIKPAAVPNRRRMLGRLRHTFPRLVTLVTVAGLVFTVGCSKDKGDQEPTVTVQVAPVEKTTIEHTVTAQAVLFPRQQAAIVPKISAPVQKFLVAGFQPLTFNLTAGILIDQPKYEPSVVMAKVIAALTTAFSFANRAFALAVSAAEILKLVQAVPGVIAVDLTQLYRTGDPSGPSQTEPLPFLPVLPARWDNLAGAIQPAQLLLLNPLGVTLTEMTS